MKTSCLVMILLALLTTGLNDHDNFFRPTAQEGPLVIRAPQEEPVGSQARPVHC